MRLSGARTRRPRALWDLPSGQCLLDHVPRVEGTAAAGMANAPGLAAQWDLHVLSVADAAMRFVLVSAATGRILESTADGIVRAVPLAGRDAHEWEVPCQVRCRGGSPRARPLDPRAEPGPLGRRCGLGRRCLPRSVQCPTGAIFPSRRLREELPARPLAPCSAAAPVPCLVRAPPSRARATLTRLGWLQSGRALSTTADRRRRAADFLLSSAPGAAPRPALWGWSPALRTHGALGGFPPADGGRVVLLVRHGVSVANFRKDQFGGSTVAPGAPRTKWTRRVPHPVLIGHAASRPTSLRRRSACILLAASP